MTMTLLQAVILSILSITLYAEAVHSIFATDVDVSSTLGLLLGGVIISGAVVLSFF
jgi:hypothetical protein